MIEITYDMEGDPRIVYDSRNLVWLDGRAVLLEEGDEGWVQLQPGEPGYVPPPPPPPPPKPKPRRRHLLIPQSEPKTNPNPIAPMPTPDDAFHYNVGPTTGGRWRPRADIQARLSPEEHAAAVAAKCAAAGVTVTAEQVAAVITASEEETIDQARRTVAIDYPGGYSRMIPTAGSSHEEPNFEGTFDNLAPDASRFLTRKGQVRLATGFTSVLGEVSAEKAAHITRIINLANGTENQYKLGKGQLTEGTDLAGVGDEFPGSAIIYIGADGTETTVPFDSIIQKDPSRLSWIVPAGMTGPQMLKLIVFLNGGLRTTIHNHPLIAVP